MASTAVTPTFSSVVQPSPETGELVMVGLTLRERDGAP
jgi:hypothetical protein